MRSVLGFAVVALALAPDGIRAQESGAFVVRLGRDTLSLEQVTRTPTRIRGESLTRSPRTSHRTYTVDLAPDGTVRRFELITRNLSSGPGPAETRSTIEFMGDSAVTTSPRGDSTVTRRLATGKGAVPYLQGIMGLMELLGRRALASQQSSDTTALVTPGASQAGKGVMSRAGGDTLVFWIETSVGRVGPWFLRFDPEGRLLSYYGKGTPFQAEVKRVPNVHLADAEAVYGNRPLGQLSARDTARASVGDTELSVDYGRPSKRGREVFGTVVPWNTVWRTGANAATQFHTPIDLVIGGTTVPAGTYTLWTIPTSAGWKLILNTQTGQWGTEYHEDRDLARVDMTVETLPQPVETFTIAIEPRAQGAVLKMTWDRTRATVPIEIKPMGVR